MKHNIGFLDRLFRLAIACILFFFSWKEGSWVLLVLALFTTYEALASWCVFYQLIGKNSCPIDKK